MHGFSLLNQGPFSQKLCLVNSLLQKRFAYNKYCCTEAKPVDTRPNLESSQTRFKRTPTNQNSPFDRLILTSVTKNLTQRRIKP